MRNYRKAITNAGAAALASAPSGNPFIIGGTALLAGGAGLLQEEREFDPNPFRPVSYTHLTLPTNREV